MHLYIIFTVILDIAVAQRSCKSSVTTASGSAAPWDICSGDIIFQDEFDSFNLQRWQHEITLGGDGNWEFQWYTNNRSNSFVRDGILYIKPTLTADDLGYSALYTDTLDINGGAPADACTNSQWYGCIRTGSSTHILNPVKSARIRTAESFSFKYGRIEVRAKTPTGDWLWPAIWMMPRYNAYGNWPTSGEIDILESRGNLKLSLNDGNIGTQLMGSTLHWGPDLSRDEYKKTHWEKTNTTGYNRDFHLYEVVWTPNAINFSVDSKLIGNIVPPGGGFWELGGWGEDVQNPWKDAGVMAPFDDEFYFIINNAVGGITYFPDQAVNVNGKPWSNNSTQAATDFWENRNMWLDTWSLEQNNDAALQVDYIRVYAL